MRTFVRKYAVITIIFLSISVQGCYTYRLNAPGKVGVTEHGEMLWSIGWGLVQEQPRIDCNGQALAEVAVRSNLLYDLLTVATLGFASPKRVEWKCAPPQPTTGTAVSDSTGGN